MLSAPKQDRFGFPSVQTEIGHELSRVVFASPPPDLPLLNKTCDGDGIVARLCQRLRHSDLAHPAFTVSGDEPKQVYFREKNRGRRIEDEPFHVYIILQSYSSCLGMFNPG